MSAPRTEFLGGSAPLGGSNGVGAQHVPAVRPPLPPQPGQRQQQLQALVLAARSLPKPIQTRFSPVFPITNNCF